MRSAVWALRKTKKTAHNDLSPKSVETIHSTVASAETESMPAKQCPSYIECRLLGDKLAERSDLRGSVAAYQRALDLGKTNFEL